MSVLNTHNYDNDSIDTRDTIIWSVLFEPYRPCDICDGAICIPHQGSSTKSSCTCQLSQSLGAFSGAVLQQQQQQQKQWYVTDGGYVSYLDNGLHGDVCSRE